MSLLMPKGRGENRIRGLIGFAKTLIDIQNACMQKQLENEIGEC